jgi:transcriptional regulator with XRE-family HTH domain
VAHAPTPDNRLREFRELSRWTLEDVAERLCALAPGPIPLDRNAVSRHELGKIRKPRRQYRRLYARLYNVSEDDLWPPGDTSLARSTMHTSFTTDALDWLADRASWDSARIDSQMAAKRAGLTHSALRAAGRIRGEVSRRDLATAVADYYRPAEASPYRLYSAHLDAATKIGTSILVRPDWVDVVIRLDTRHDRLTPDAVDPAVTAERLTDDMASLALQRLAETQVLGTRLVDMPLYRLLSVDLTSSAVSGTVGLASFTDYALTADLLEVELLDSLTTGAGVPLRDAYLPDLASVLDLPGRLCAGGTLALCAIARPASRFRGPADYVLLIQERSGSVVNAARRLAVIPKGFHQPMTDVRADAQLSATLRREMEEELFGRTDIDNTVSTDRRADPMHPSRLSEPMRWLDAHPDSFRMECTGFGINLISGNYEFPALVVIDDDEFWTRYGGTIEANWETAGLRQYSSLDRDLLTQLAHDPAWSNEGLFAYLEGLHRLSQLHPDRTNTPTIQREPA